MNQIYELGLHYIFSTLKPDDNDLLYSKVNGKTISGAIFFRNKAENPSGPTAFLTSSLLSNDITTDGSIFSKQNLLLLALVFGVKLLAG